MSKLFKNIIYNLLGQAIVLLISFAAIKLIFHRLGAEALGIIYFVTSLNAIFAAVLEMGFSSTIIKEISVHFGSDDDYVKKLTRTFSFFYWGIYIIVGLVIFFIAPFFVQKWIHLSAISPATAINIIRILGIASITALPVSFYSGLIYGLQKMEFNNLINIAAAGLQQFGAFLILILGGGLLPVIYWFAASYVFQVAFYFFVSAHFFSFSFLIPKISLDVIKRNFKFISSTALISIFSTIQTQTDKIIISKLLPVATLGYYSFTYSSVSQGTLLTGAVSRAAYPLFSNLAKKDNRSSLMSQYHKLQDLICFGILPIFAAVPFALVPVFCYIFNEKIAYLLLLPTVFLCLGFYMNGTLAIPYMFSLAVNKPFIAAKVNFYALFVVLPIMAILIYFLGLVGAGLSWVFYNIFSYIYFVPRICKECVDIKAKDWYFHVFRIFILTILTYGVSWFILEKINNHSIIALTLAYLAASAIFLFCSYFLITKEFRKTILYYLRLMKIKIPK